MSAEEAPAAPATGITLHSSDSAADSLPRNIDVDAPDSPRDDASDHSNEGVREKLKKTSIAPPPKEDEIMTEPRRARKRSHDESEEDNSSEGQEDGNERRRVKREERKTKEREGRAGLKPEPSAASLAERMLSPKGERKRALEEKENVTDREEKAPRTEEEKGTKEKAPESKKEDAPAEPAAKIPPTSGFANTSTASPFAAAGSTNIFAQSKFGQLASSSASPFAAAKPSFGNTSSASPFAASGTTNIFAAKPASSGFGTLGASAPSSGFGSSFGSGGSFSLKSTKKPAKPFGAPSDDENSDGEDGSDDDKAAAKPSLDAAEDTSNVPEALKEKKEVMTGEENEITVFKSMGKVFAFDTAAKRWKDRGRGQIKLNRTIPPGNDDFGTEGTPEKQSARFIMRTEGTYTLVLNSPVYKGMKFGEANGGPPTGQTVTMLAMGDGGGFVTTTLKFKSNAVARELWDRVSELKEEFFGADEEPEKKEEPKKDGEKSEGTKEEPKDTKTADKKVEEPAKEAKSQDNTDEKKEESD